MEKKVVCTCPNDGKKHRHWLSWGCDTCDCQYDGFFGHPRLSIGVMVTGESGHAGTNEDSDNASDKDKPNENKPIDK
jgi:hypothetical protein